MLKHLTTEGRNPASEAIDTLSPLEIVRLMNAEDAQVAAAVGREAEKIAAAIETIAQCFQRGGRLIYIGAGTSGRLGVLDATECPPTFNSSPGQVVGLIAGGSQALTRAIEGAEDRPELAVQDLQGIGLSDRDVVVGIATSGRTPYVVGGLNFSRQQGAFTVALSCNATSTVADCAELSITPIVGPEVISGSTRLKAGTATKLVLNMLTTGAMVRIGKTYGNLMVDLRATNTKLRDRTVRIVAHLTGEAEEHAQRLLDQCGGELKTAVVLHQLNQGQSTGDAVATARHLLVQSGGHLRGAVHAAGTHSKQAPVVWDDLILGIDGGGSGTVALLARRSEQGPPAVLGRGIAGAANPQAVGFPAAFRVIDEAVSAAFAGARIRRGEVGAVCLALAGAGRDEDQRCLEQWAASRKLARTTTIVHDALPVLADGTAEGWGVAVIAGTGSLAFGRDATGRTARSGGWGYLFGDEGSGYWIALAALRAVASAADGRSQPTELTPRFMAALEIGQPQQLVPAVYGRKLDRTALAALAPLVVEAAEAGDVVALEIVDAAARSLAEMAASVAKQLDLADRPFPLALAGGVLTESLLLRKQLTKHLQRLGVVPQPINVVVDPVLGALKMAALGAG